MNIESHLKEVKNKLEIIYLEDKRIRLKLYKSHSKGPILLYEENEIEIEKVDNTINDINYYLTLVNTLKKPDVGLFKQLQRASQTLYFDLLGHEIKKSMQKTPYKTLDLIIDEQLLYIPWELLFNGQKFLFEQFNIGRQVTTPRNGIEEDRDDENQDLDQLKSKLRMLIITDPTEDLKMAHNEGELIFKEFHKEKTVHIEFYSSEMVNLDFVKKNLSEYDIVHYAGHVEYDSSNPNKSGWILPDGIFSVADIKNIGDSKAQIPSLIFCNACQSGAIEKCSNKDIVIASHFSKEQLVQAFMRAGVKYYIGTFTKISDVYAKYMGIEFYHQLLQNGKSIGESLKKARESFRGKFGTKSFSWTNYIYYGRPDHYLITEKIRSPRPIPQNSKPYGKKWRWRISIALHGKKWRWRISIALLLLFCSIPLWFVLKRQIRPPIPPQPVEVRIEEFWETISKIVEEKENLVAKRREWIALGKAEIQLDEWTSTELGLAIFVIYDPTEKLTDWAIKITKGLERRLTKLISHDVHFRVVERKELNRILKEKGLMFIDLLLRLDEDHQRLLGKLLQARIMLFVEGYRESSDIYLYYKLVNSDTGVILNLEDDIKLTKKVNSSILAEKIYNQIKKDINSKFPLQGRILEIKDNFVIINIGTKVGVKEGNIFEVLGLDFRNEMKKIIGKIKVISVDLRRAECEIIEGKDLSSELRIRLLEGS